VSSSPQYSRSERRADIIIHVLGLAFAVGACIGLVASMWDRADLAHFIALGLYAFGLIAMLSCSALYNMTDHPGRKGLFRRFDHAAIFVMIAGTYTPFLAIKVGGAWGASLLAFVWVVAAFGVALKLLTPARFERLSIAAYLLIGWSILVVLDPLFAAVSAPGIILLAIGGVLYSVGVVFHLSVRLPYHNAIWHLFVLAAAVCHYAAVLGDVVAMA
jgi:hemolysin III